MATVGMDFGDARLVFPVSVPVASTTVGVLVTVLAALVPARSAAKVSPLAAMRHHGVPSEQGVGCLRTGTALLSTGLGTASLIASAALADTTTGGPVLAVGVLLTLTGFVTGGPVRPRRPSTSWGQRQPRCSVWPADSPSATPCAVRAVPAPQLSL